jgi:hypothetical protein
MKDHEMPISSSQSNRAKARTQETRSARSPRIVQMETTLNKLIRSTHQILGNEEHFYEHPSSYLHDLTYSAQMKPPTNDQGHPGSYERIVARPWSKVHRETANPCRLNDLSPMKRWESESITDQPWNALEAFNMKFSQDSVSRKPVRPTMSTSNAWSTEQLGAGRKNDSDGFNNA